MKRSPEDEGAQHREGESCKKESEKGEGIIGGVDVVVVIVVVVVGGRGYGAVYCSDGISSLAGRLNCEGGATVEKLREARF